MNTIKALLLIDIQNDFLPGGRLAVEKGDEIIPLVNRIQDRFDLVVATQDWHPAGHKSFASSHPGRKVFDTIEWKGKEQVLWPDHCVQGSEGAGLSSSVNWNRTEAIFRKGTDPQIDSYSAFYDNGHQKSTALTEYLRGKNVKEVYLAGLAGDFCVYFSALDAISEGFQTVVIEDATRAISGDGFQRAKKDLVNKGGIVIHSDAMNQNQVYQDFQP